jgi:multisubunit Na+/H+ antiporter MnhB subunit
MPAPRDVHRQGTRLMAVAMVVLGIAILVRTLAAGGGALALGVLIGALFVAAGAARLYLQLRGRA